MDVALLIRQHEGESRTAYHDSLGKHTIGVGRLLDSPKGLSPSEVEFLFQTDLRSAELGVMRLVPRWAGLDDVRFAALADMVFQIGEAGVGKFRRTLEHLRAAHWEAAAAEMLVSRWARQTPKRAARIAEMIRTGRWPDGAP